MRSTHHLSALKSWECSNWKVRVWNDERQQFHTKKSMSNFIIWQLMGRLRRVLLLETLHVIGWVITKRLGDATFDCEKCEQETKIEKLQQNPEPSKCFRPPKITSFCNIAIIIFRIITMSLSNANKLKLTWLVPIYRSISCSLTGPFTLWRSSFDVATTIWGSGLRS